MAEIKLFKYLWRGKRTKWTYRLTAMLPGAIIITPDDTIVEVKLPRGFINVKKLEAAHKDITIGLPEQVPQLSLVINLHKKVLASKELVEALQTKNIVHMQLGDTNIETGVVWRLECLFEGKNEFGEFVEIFHGVTRRETKIKYSYSKKTLEVKAIAIIKAITDSIPTQSVINLAAFYAIQNAPQYPEIVIYSILYANVPNPWVLYGYPVPHFFKLQSFIDIAKVFIREYGKIITRLNDFDGDVDFPLPIFFKQIGQDDAVGSSISKEDLYLSSDFYDYRSYMGGKIAERFPNLWEMYKDLYEFSLAKGDVHSRFIYATHLLNQGISAAKPQLGDIYEIECDGEDDGITEVTLNAVSVTADNNYSDIAEWKGGKGGSGISFSATLFFTTYPPCVEYATHFNYSSGTTGYTLDSAVTNRIPPLGIYYTDTSPLAPDEPAIFKAHESVIFNYAGNSENIYEWTDYAPITSGNSYRSEPSAAVFKMQKDSGIASQYIGVVTQLFGSGLIKINGEFSYEHLAKFQYGGSIGFLPSRLNINWDLSDLNDDYGVVSFLGASTPLSYDIDFEKETVKLEFIKRL